MHTSVLGREPFRVQPRQARRWALRTVSALIVCVLTGYLGGATAINLRANDPPFESLFPVFFGVLVWTPIYLRDARLRALLPLRREDQFK